jgi:signal transduction histidine kinase
MDLLEQHPGLPIHLTGSAILLFAIIHLQRDDDIMRYDAAESAILILLAGALFYGGYRMTRSNLSSEEGLRVTIVAAVFAWIGVLITALVVVIRTLEGHPIGEERFFLFTAGAAGAAVGTPLGYYYNGLKTSHQELRRQYEHTEAINKRLAVVNRVLRHNIRNELTILLGLTEARLEAADDACARTDLEQIEEHLTRVHTLSTTAQRLNQVWNEDQTIQVDLTDLVTSSVANIRPIAPDVTIHTDLPETVCVNVHPRMAWAVTEALENAVKHNKDADLEIIVGIQPSSDTTDRVEFTITDTGSGIPHIETDALAQPEETPLTHGTGLGLWLMYWIVEKSNGHVEFEPNEPTGTVVRMELPIHPSSPK